MTTGEDQPELVIVHRALLERVLLGGWAQPSGFLVALVAARFPPVVIDGAMACGRDDPAGGAGRESGRGPLFGSNGEGVLDGVFREVDVAQQPHEHRDRSAVLVEEDAGDIDHGTPPWKGRTSTGSVVARDSRRAHLSAASRSGASITVKPPRCSLASMNGPSVSSSSRTTVAVCGGCKPPANTHAPAACISSVSASTSRMISPRFAGSEPSPNG